MMQICINLDLRLIERFNGHKWRDKMNCIDYYGPIYAHNNVHIHTHALRTPINRMVSAMHLLVGFIVLSI